jgi:hypothetical protein
MLVLNGRNDYRGLSFQKNDMNERRRREGIYLDVLNSTILKLGTCLSKSMISFILCMCSKFRLYLLSSTCVVACQADVTKYMLEKPILSVRIGKWLMH